MPIRATRTRNQKPHVCSDMWYDIISIFSLLGYTIQSYSNFGKGRACPSQKGSSARSSKRRPNNLVIRGVSRSSGDRGNDHNGTTRTSHGIWGPGIDQAFQCFILDPLEVFQAMGGGKIHQEHSFAGSAGSLPPKSPMGRCFEGDHFRNGTGSLWASVLPESKTRSLVG